MNPFKITGPALISFSGGRTSGYMLRRILDEGIDAETHVVFANTGKERTETLDFVRDCSASWGVPIVWLERGRGEVSHETASRRGEPFAKLIEERNYLPNIAARICTQELKVMLFEAFMLDRGYVGWWNVVGLRADEPRRVAKRRAEVAELWDNVLPLADAGVTKRDVMEFWAAQPFDLRLRPWESNCDLCFLKGQTIRSRIMRDQPRAADWWIAQEQKIGAQFDKARSYSALRVLVDSTPMMFDPDEEGMDCTCTD